MVLQSIKTIREIAQACSKKDTVAKDLKAFFKRLRVRCWLIEEAAKPITDPTCHLLHQLLTRLQSMIIPVVLDNLCAPDNLSLYSLLWALISRWEGSDLHIRVDLILPYLTLGSNSDEIQELEVFLDN